MGFLLVEIEVYGNYSSTYTDMKIYNLNIPLRTKISLIYDQYFNTNLVTDWYAI
jgi:hypothetical protein